MPTLHADAASCECLIFTFKEGVLSAMAHDLKLRVTSLQLDLQSKPWSVVARFDARSLRVVCARAGGRDSPAPVSERDRRTIEKSTADEVLNSKRFPEVIFRSEKISESPSGYSVRGTLELHGRSQPLTFEVVHEGAQLVAELPLHQPDFGIAPYRAMLGTLRVQPTVRVRISLPAPAELGKG